MFSFQHHRFQKVNESFLFFSRTLVSLGSNRGAGLESGRAFTTEPNQIIKTLDTHQDIEPSNDKMSGSVTVDEPAVGMTRFGIVSQLALATTIPLLIYFRGPLLHLINEYRLYRRCKQYPHIIVCKGESQKATNPDQGRGDYRVSDWIIPIAAFLWKVLIWSVKLLLDVIVSGLTFVLAAKDTKESVTNKQAPNVKQPNSVAENEENHSTKPTESKKLDSAPVQSSQTASVPKMKRDLFVEEERAFENLSKKQSYTIPDPLEGHGRLSRISPLTQQIVTVQPMQQIPKKMFSVEDGIVRRKASKRRLPSPMAATLARPVPIDSSSLSEKMRKRRLNGELSNGMNAIPQQQHGSAASRKKRKLNCGRMPLQGYVAKRPTVGAWKTTKALDKREREEREERLLRGMNRKRSKPTNEKTSFVGTEGGNTSNSTALTANSSVPAPSTSTPAFSFGQPPAKTPAAENASSEKEVVPAPVSMPAPSFQFGTNKQTASDPSQPSPDNTTAAAKAEVASHAPSGFSFGNVSSKTSNSATIPAKPEPTQGSSAAPSTSAPAPTFGGASASSASTPAPAPTFGAPPASVAPNKAPTFGAAPTAAPTFGAAPAPSAQTTAPTFGATHASAPAFGAAPAPSAQTKAPTFGAAPTAAPTFGAAPSAAPSATATATAPTFGAAPTAAPTFGATPAPSAQATAPTFGSAPASATTHGAGPPAFGAPKPATANTFGAPSGFAGSQQSNGQFSFGNTKENQVPGPSNGFMKPQSSNGANLPPLGMKGGFPIGGSNGTATPSFGGGSGIGFSTGNGPTAAAGTASARRLARKSRNRRR